MFVLTRLLLPLALFFSSASLINRWFRGRGIMWFWLAKDVPPLQWAARLTLAVAMLLLLVPRPQTMAVALALFLAHLGILNYAKAKMP